MLTFAVFSGAGAWCDENVDGGGAAMTATAAARRPPLRISSQASFSLD
ncbi:hypothetical protein ACP70R_033920 [Stipagrostis hirtigluma subsp. patula]